MKKKNMLKRKKKKLQPSVKPQNVFWEAVKYSLIFVSIQVVILSLFFVMLHDTRQKNSDNTEIITGTVEKIETWKPFRAHSSLQIFITVDGEEFFLSWENISALDGIKEEKTIYLTILKDKDITYWGNQREIVDIRSDSKVYYDIAIHNSHMRFSRIGACIFIPVIWLFFTFWFGLMAFVMVRDCILEVKRKSKKAKESTRRNS